MDILIASAAAALGFSSGLWAGIRLTARNADRLLAVMSPDQIASLARRTRARRTLLETPPPDGFETTPRRRGNG